MSPALILHASQPSVDPQHALLADARQGPPFVKAARSPLALRMTEADAAAAPAFTGDVKAELTKALALEDATKVATAFSDLKSKGGLKKWNNQAGLKSRAVSQNEVCGPICDPSIASCLFPWC